VGVKQMKEVVKMVKESKPVKITFKQELDEVSRITRIPRATLLEMSWNHYKLSKDYAIRVLSLKQENEE
jgi:hypothetical protein